MKKIEKKELPIPYGNKKVLSPDFEIGGKYNNKLIVLDDYIIPQNNSPESSASVIKKSLEVGGDHWIIYPEGVGYIGEIVFKDRNMILTYGQDIIETHLKLEKEISRLSIEEYIPCEGEKPKKYYDSPEWACRVIKIHREQKEKCYDCKDYKIKDVHHLTYDRFMNEPLEDLVGLCGYCHLTRHDLPSFYKPPEKPPKSTKNKIYTKAQLLADPELKDLAKFM